MNSWKNMMILMLLLFCLKLNSNCIHWESLCCGCFFCSDRIFLRNWIIAICQKFHTECSTGLMLISSNWSNPKMSHQYFPKQKNCHRLFIVTAMGKTSKNSVLIEQNLIWLLLIWTYVKRTFMYQQYLHTNKFT